MADTTDGGTPAAETTTTARPRRRAASRPAGPPPDVDTGAAPPAEVTTAEPATPAKRTRKKAAAAPAEAAETAAAAAPAAPAKKTTKRAAKKAAASAAAESETPAGEEAAAPAPRRRRKAALAPAFSADAEVAESVEGAVETPAGDAATPVKRTRKASKKVAKTSPAEPDDAAGTAPAPPVALFQAPEPTAATAGAEGEPAEDASAEGGDTGEPGERTGRRRRRGGRGRSGRGAAAGEAADGSGDGEGSGEADEASAEDAESEDAGAAGEGSSSRRRRRRRRGGSGGGDSADDPERTVVHVREGRDEVTSVKGSTRLEAKKQRRRDGRASGRRRTPILSEAEFLARRESVDRVMVVRETGERTQIAVLEDDVLVEHYVDRRGTASLIGNVYLGKVQNVLPSMEAAFVDIGRGRNAVLYAGEVNWDAAGLEGQPKRIEHALKPGESVLVQVTKDPIGHKGARLTAQVTLPGRFLVYVPDGSLTGISRKLPDTERSRLKSILKTVVPEDAGVIVRTAAEGASEEELTRDVARLRAQWEDIAKKAATGSAPSALYTEPDLTVRVVRDLFNEDFAKLVVSGAEAQETVEAYVGHVAPDLVGRVEKYAGDGDVFAEHRIDEQLAKALERKVWLPSGGSLVIDRTEAMTVVDVNTGKFTGSGGNLEETVTRNNLEAAEEIVRQLRLRDIGGIIVVDFIDMVLEKNRDLVLRRLTECLARDRTKHQVAEVSSLGLVQMTRKRIGLGLLESFSEPCEHCRGRGLLVHSEPVDPKPVRTEAPEKRRRSSRKKAAAAD